MHIRIKYEIINTYQKLQTLLDLCRMLQNCGQLLSLLAIVTGSGTTGKMWRRRRKETGGGLILLTSGPTCNLAVN